MGHVNIGVVFSCIENQSKSSGLFITKLRALGADWLILKSTEKAAFSIQVLYHFVLFFCGNNSSKMK